MKTMELAINGDRLLSELHALARISDAEPAENGTAVTRVVFSPRDLEARAWLGARVAEAGLSLRVDPIGNTFVTLKGTEPYLPAVATGSHIDAIPDAGMYDGTVGVLGGLEALRAVQESGIQPRRSIELIVFTAEEPTRFGIGCLGSRMLSSNLAPDVAATLLDAGEQTVEEVRSAAGFQGSLSEVHLPSGAYHAFIELHIEQGPVLEKAGVPLGIVTQIAAPASYRFALQGFGGHAGGLLMPDRHDALCAASQLILAVEHHALNSGSLDTVATVGTCDVYPGAVNSVPSRVHLQLDLRDTDPIRRESVMQAIREDCVTIERQRGVTVTETLVNADSPAHSSSYLVAVLEGACAELKYSSLRMVARAYHDSSFMAGISPVAMLFIPCRDGVSHRPDEYAAPEDILRGTAVLAQSLARLASDAPAPIQP